MSVYCERCKMSFKTEGVEKMRGERLVCNEDGCTRHFSVSSVVSRSGEHIATVYQLPDQIELTKVGAQERRRAGLPVDNGGMQEN